MKGSNFDVMVANLKILLGERDRVLNAGGPRASVTMQLTFQARLWSGGPGLSATVSHGPLSATHNTTLRLKSSWQPSYSVGVDSLI